MTAFALFFAEFVAKVLQFIATDDLGLMACGFFAIGFAFTLFYNLSGSEKL